MAVNTLTFNQASTLLAAIVSQATGHTTIAPTNTYEFVTVGQTALLTDTDKTINAVSQVLSRTIFSVRPYNAKFAGMRVDSEKWGAITRKLVAIDKPIEDDDRFKLVEGQAVDMYVVNKPEVLQLNFYGQNVYQKAVTIFRDQLNVAFSGPAEFSEFISMIMQNVSDQLEQATEEMSRACLANFMGGKISGNGADVVHLLTEFNDENGTTYDYDDIMQMVNFVPFAKFAYGRIMSISDKMTERSELYHTNLTSKKILRHTPKADQRMYMLADFMNKIRTTVLADTYNAAMLSVGEYESVNYWQAIDTPSGINVTPSVLSAAGTITHPASPVAQSHILGIIADREAFGVTSMNEYSSTTPFNSRGGYYNMYFHAEKKWWNDFTENAVVFVID